MNRYNKGFAKLTRHCINKIMDVAQQPMTSKATNTPVWDADLCMIPFEQIRLFIF